MYDLVPDETQLAIIDAARAVAGAWTTSDGGRSGWAAVTESNLLALGTAEEHGGAGAGACGEVLALIELGAARVTPAVVAPMLAAHLLLEQPELAARTGLTVHGLLTGEHPVALADSWWWSHDPAAPVQDWRVLPMEGAQWAVAVSSAGLRLLDVRAAETVPGFDRAVRLTKVTGAAVGEPAGSALLDRTLTLVAALQVGLARKVLDVCVEYAKARHQFGKPIGSFQAVKHMLADMAVELEAAQACTAHSAVLIDAGVAGGAAARTAKVVAGQAAVTIARLGIQVHGGIGVTDECEMHLHLRRAHLLDQLFGSSDFHSEGILRSLAALPD